MNARIGAPAPRLARAVALLLLGFSLLTGRAEAVDVTTHHYDNARTGWNRSETLLTPAALRSGRFAQLISLALDNQVDAQPLYLAGVTMGDRTRNVLFVVTESNTVYAIDADLGVVLLQRRLGVPVETGRGKPIDCGNNASTIGITSTPVIDRASKTLYAIAFLWENGAPVYRLFALDIVTLADKAPPRLIQKTARLSDGTSVAFDASISRQRPALTLVGGRVYAAFGSFCDHAADRLRGWIMSFDAGTLAESGQAELLDRRPTAEAPFHLTSIWMSGAGPSVDDEGDIYVITGNSRPSKIVPGAPTDQTPYLAQSVVKLTPALDNVLDYFTPRNFRLLDIIDQDFGAGGTLVVPETASGGRKLLVAAGKQGTMFLLDRDDMGKLATTTPDRVLAATTIGKCWCAQSLYVGADGIARVVSSGGATVSSWKIETSPKPRFVKEWDAQSSLGTVTFQKGFFTSVSSDDTKAGTAVIWAVQRPTVPPPSLTLWAFDAETGAALLALPAGQWPNTGGSANTVPVVADGHVYVASFKELKIYGLREPSTQAETVRTEPEEPAASPNDIVVYGFVDSLAGDELTLKTPDKPLEIDVGPAVAAHKAVALTPGVAVKIFGQRAQDGKTLTAISIEYAPENPALWKTSALK